MFKYRIAACGGVLFLCSEVCPPLPLALQDIKAFALPVEDYCIASEALLAAMLWRESVWEPGGEVVGERRFLQGFCAGTPSRQRT